MADVICPDCQRLTSGRCGRHSTVIFPISGSTERRVPYRCPVCEGCGTLRRDGSSLVMTPQQVTDDDFVALRAVEQRKQSAAVEGARVVSGIEKLIDQAEKEDS